MISEVQNNIDKSGIPVNGDSKNREQVKSDILNMINCPSILTGMSHEMRTHMNSIMAFSFLIRNNGLNTNEKEEFVDHIFSSCEQLMSLFENFLDSAIIDTGNSKAEFKKCKISTILEDLLSEFRVILKKENHPDLVLILENQFSDNEEVCIDSNKVVRVIRSLFQNAVYNTESGYIKIGYYFRDNNAVFYVLDSGTGYAMSKEFLNSENLNDSLSKHNDTFSAINLSLARKLITLMDGKAWIENNGPSGTGMYFSIPMVHAVVSKVLINKYPNSKMAI